MTTSSYPVEEFLEQHDVRSTYCVSRKPSAMPADSSGLSILGLKPPSPPVPSSAPDGSNASQPSPPPSTSIFGSLGDNPLFAGVTSARPSTRPRNLPV